MYLVKISVPDAFPAWIEHQIIGARTDMETFHLKSYVRAACCSVLKKKVLHLCNSLKKKRERMRERKQYSVPPSPLFLLVISTDISKTEGGFLPLGQIPLHFSVNAVSQPKTLV